MLVACFVLAGCGDPKVNYKGLKLLRYPTKRVTATDTEKFILGLRQQSARGTPLSPATPIRFGHRALIDFAGTIDGEPFPGGSLSGFPLVLGSGHMIPGFEEGIVGMKAGQSKVVEVAFPRDYHEASLAGKPARFTITIRAAESLVLPPLDDSLAVNVSGGAITTLSQLRGKVKEQLYQNEAQRAEMSLRSQAVQALLDQWPRSPSKRTIEKELDKAVQQQLQAASQRGMGPAQGGPDADTIRVQSLPAVERALKLSQVLKSIAKREGIKISDDELDRTVEQMAQMRGQDSRTVLQQLQESDMLEALRGRILEDRVITMILQNAIVEEAPK